MNNHPIGIVDSGSGGLSVAGSIRALLPREPIIYLGDHAQIPYGEKSTDEIKSRVVRIIRHFHSLGVKMVVVACNTATVAGIDVYRKQFPGIPVIGVVPVIKTAAEISKTKHFIVLSTHYTATSRYQRALIGQFASDCTVSSVGSKRLVPLLEEGNLSDPRVADELRHMLRRFQASRHDVIVLGCTHYPFLIPVIRAIVGNDVTILDSGDAVARQVQRILIHRDELSDQHNPSETYYTTGDTLKVARVFGVLTGRNIKVTHVNIQ
jgi:glutamate racemase